MIFDLERQIRLKIESMIYIIHIYVYCLCSELSKLLKKKFQDPAQFCQMGKDTCNINCVNSY